MRQGAMVVAGGLEADDDRTTDLSEVCCEAIVVSLGGHDRHPPATPAFGALDQRLIAVLGHIHGYQHDVGGSILYHRAVRLTHAGGFPSC